MPRTPKYDNPLVRDPLKYKEYLKKKKMYKERPIISVYYFKHIIFII